MIPKVRIDMSEQTGRQLADVLLIAPREHAARLHDQLWLSTCLVQARRQVRLAERPAFNERANRILEALDP